MTSSALRYATFGAPSDPALVFLHGFMGARNDWSEIVDHFSGTHFCICIDAPGHGESIGYETLDAYSMESACRGVVDILEGLKVKQASLVGYSMGGRTALALACIAPERWRQLYVEGASPGLETESERIERRALDEQRARSLERGDFERFLAAWYEHPFFTSMARDKVRFEALLEKRRLNEPVELAKSLRGMGVGSQASYWNQLASLSMPILFIVGEEDEKFVEIGKAMQSLSPASQLAIVRGAGHNVHYERPSEFIQLLTDCMPL